MKLLQSFAALVTTLWPFSAKAVKAFQSAFCAILCLLGLGVGSASAALFDRGGGLLYDNVLNVTWLQDANFAKTSGYDADGRMTWSAANTWAANLVYGGFDDWRLARNSPVGADWNYNPGLAGSTDIGYNITSPNSELPYMYYVNLGLKGHYNTSGVFQPDFGIFGDGTGSGFFGGQNDVGLVRNLQSFVYWSGTADVRSPDNAAWILDTNSAYQNIGAQSDEYHGWAVRSGDVMAAIPEPETYAMLLAGLGVLGFAARRRQRKSVQA